MPNVKVCVRFRPLSSKERAVHGDSICIQPLDESSFVFEDKEEDITFFFDRVFYEDAQQDSVYEFLAKPTVQDAINGINGTIITYGQTGAGKTFTVEGFDILASDDDKKGLLPRVVDELFQYLSSSSDTTAFTLKLSMVEVYMEKVRDLLDLSKDNLQLKESKIEGIFLAGATEIPILDPAEALTCLSQGISNRAVGETYMNMGSSRSHCIYSFLVQQESTTNGSRMKTAKLMIVDLAGSEKVEKTGAEGRILEEAKMINKSLSALGNVINALTSGNVNHIPYRNSKLTRILQDAVGGNSRTALLCCCSPSSSNASESLSTLRFGTRAKLIKTPLRQSKEDLSVVRLEKPSIGNHSDADVVVLPTTPEVLQAIVWPVEQLTDQGSDSQMPKEELGGSLQRKYEELNGLMAELSRENERLVSEIGQLTMIFSLGCLVMSILLIIVCIILYSQLG